MIDYKIQQVHDSWWTKPAGGLLQICGQLGRYDCARCVLEAVAAASCRSFSLTTHLE